MKSSLADFDPPQSSNTASSRPKKTYIGSSVDELHSISSNDKKVKSKQAQPKRKRTLSVYNIFYHDTRKKILEERGYTESDDNRLASPPKKRGRPRGPNYQKKKKPHHAIAFAELTKEIAIRWEIHKEEYHRKYDAIVEAQKARDKAEKEAQEKEEKSAKLVESRASAENRYSYVNAEGPCASSPVNTHDPNQFSDYAESGDRNTLGMSNESFSLIDPSSYYENYGYEANGYHNFEKYHDGSSHDYRSSEQNVDHMELSNSSHRSRNRNYSPLVFHDNSDHTRYHQNNRDKPSRRTRYDEHVGTTYDDKHSFHSPESSSYHRNHDSDYHYNEMNSSRSSNSQIHHHYLYHHIDTGNQFPNYSPVGSYSTSQYSNRHEGGSSMNGYQNYDMNYQTNSSNDGMGHQNTLPHTPYNSLNHPASMPIPEHQHLSGNMHNMNPMHSDIQQHTHGYYSDQVTSMGTHQPFYPGNHNNGYYYNPSHHHLHDNMNY